MEFNCSGCGCCCRRIDVVVLNVMLNVGNDPMFSFPYSWNEDGVCDKLVDNRCSVYSERPLICNIEDGAKVFDVSREDFYRENYEACNKMMDEEGIDPKFRVGFNKKDNGTK